MPQTFLPNKHDFLTWRSCLSDLLFQEELATHLMEEGHFVDLVYLDLAKAYDSISHWLQMDELKASGIDGNALNWVNSYPLCLSYQVDIDGVLSDDAPCLMRILHTQPCVTSNHECHLLTLFRRLYIKWICFSSP